MVGGVLCTGSRAVALSRVSHVLNESPLNQFPRQQTLLINSKLFFVLSVSGQVILVSANKLTRYIEPSQLTNDFGGSLDYDHSDWLNKRLVTTSFILDLVQMFWTCIAMVTVSGYKVVWFHCTFQQVFEKFTKESTSLLDELSVINESDKSTSTNKDKYVHTHFYLYVIHSQPKKKVPTTNFFILISIH